MTTDDLFGGEQGGVGFAFDNDNGKEEWLTPPHILAALGQFDLDPCSPPAERRPWPTAAHHYTVHDNGLMQPWAGRVWCNPPYGREAIKFLARLAEHGDGIALTFARTETRMFQEFVFGQASAVFFLRGRLQFCDFRGRPSENSAGAPSVLIAYGDDNADTLAACGLEGAFVDMRGMAMSAPIHQEVA